MRKGWMRRRVVGLCVLAATLAVAYATSASGAVTETFSTAQSEFPPDPFWGGAGQPNQGNYSVYYLSPGYVTFHRGPYYVNLVRMPTLNYFSFDLRSACTASAVTLRVVRGSEESPTAYMPSAFYGGADYRLHEVTTPASDVNMPNAGIQYPGGPGTHAYQAYYDLGDGPIYGGGSYPLDGSPSDVLSFPLNPAGVAGFNTARGGFFTLGGEGGGRSFYVGGFPIPYRMSIFAGVTDPAQLVVTCALPKSKEECKNGGWQTYGVFKNQGDCVSFVATGGKNPPDKKTG
jgi:hypothetical protein